MIYVVVALSAEARPLAAHLQLERVDVLSPRPVYCRSDMALIVSGVGKEAMAQAVDDLAKAVPSDSLSVWLNIGVAGHRQLEVGTAVLASRVTDGESGETIDLVPPQNLHLATGEVRTVVQVETQFASDALYEMEASAFCARSRELTQIELLQVLKIVSDNRKTGTVAVSAHQVQGLVEKALPKLDLLISNLHRRGRRLGG